MRPKLYDMDLIDVDVNGIAENQTLAGAGNLTLDGALADLGTAGAFNVTDGGYSVDVGGVQIAIDSAGDVSAVVFTVTGTDQDNKTQTEAITGVTTTAIESTKYWRDITQIAASAAVASNVFVGPVDEAVSRTIPLDYQSTKQATVAVDVTGTVSFTVQETLDDIQTSVNAVQSAQWFNITALTTKTADTVGAASVGATAIRLLINSYSSGAELQMHVSQPSASV